MNGPRTQGANGAPAKALTVPQKIGFLLLDNFTLMAQASAIEPLRMANQLSGRELYEWITISADGQPVRASDGLQVMPDAAITDPLDLDMVILCSGIAPHKSILPAHITFLQHQARLGRRIGAVCTGSLLLAKAGLLDGHKASVHWECIAGMQEAHPRVLVTTRLFTIDRDRLTASGGTAPLDMMLHLIGQQHGRDLMAAISEMFMCDRLRGEHEQQRIPLKHVLGTSQPKLLEIVSLMEANIEEPLELEELARYVNVSRRQIERLFLKYLQVSPSRYYLSLRLNRARQLLRQTSMMIIEVATACGFVSTPHFSKCYREFFGVPPRNERTCGDPKAVAAALRLDPAPQHEPVLDGPEPLPSRVSSAEIALLLAQGESTYGSVSRRMRHELMV
ncbi:MAG: GlxA family transcriptional regulator [Rhodocyclaceae bacterium]